MLLSKMKSAASRSAISGSGSTLIEIASCRTVYSAGAMLRLNWLSRHHSIRNALRQIEYQGQKPIV
jgi:hypothetical protein